MLGGILRHSSRFNVLSLTALMAACCAIWLLSTGSSQGSPSESMPALQGEEAVSYLKEQGLYASLSEAMRAARYGIYESRHSLRARPDEMFYANNPSQQYQAFFSRESVRVAVGKGDQEKLGVGMKLAGYGYGDQTVAVTPGRLKAKGNRIEIARSVAGSRGSAARGQGSGEGDFAGNDKRRTTDDGQITEWYVNGEEGLEQVMSYGKLSAHDATGRELESHMKVDGGEVWLEVNDRGAEYPVGLDSLFQQVKKLTASDGEAGDRFGTSVSISGATIVVGAHEDDSARGAAYVFERNQGGAGLWGEVTKLTASDGAGSDRFGFSVSISGDIIVVGALQDDSSRGAAYVFERNQGGADFWGEVKKLTASDGAASDLFGVSVSISCDAIVVGAFGDDSLRGSAYVFERNEGGADLWGEVKKLTASDGAASDRFGVSVSISCDAIVVGAAFVDSRRGAAYVFERNRGGADLWGQVKKLTASDGAASDLFGVSVSISCDTIVVGASQDDSARGSAYVFASDCGDWVERDKQTASDGAAGDQFAFSVSISGDTIVVGANVDDSNRGSAYVFKRNQGGADLWGQVKKLTASDGAATDNFGESVSISCDTIVVGARGDDLNRGSAYVFERNFDPDNPGTPLANNWGEVKKLTASDGAASDRFGESVSISCDAIVVGDLGTTP